MQEARRVEERILLLCARAGLQPEQIAELRTMLGTRVDWPHLMDLAERHAMTPLLAHHLQALGDDASIPTAVRASLRVEFTANAARSLMLAAELRTVLGEFAAAGIAALPYKGPLISMKAYGSLALRRMRDLDLLISGHALDDARQMLARRGFRQYTRLLRGPLRLRLEYQCGLVRDSDSAHIELHWMVAPPNMARGPSFEDLWARRVTHEFQGAVVPRLSTEDVILTLCIHGSKHGWERLEWISTLAEMVRKSPDADWSAILRRGTEVGAERMVRLGLRLTHDLLGAPLPASVDSWIAEDAPAGELAAEVSARLFHGPPVTGDAGDLAAFQWRLQDRTLGKLRFVWYWLLVRLGRRAAAVAWAGTT